MSNVYQPYWSPSREQFWANYTSVRYSFPKMSIPRNMDLPEIDVFLIVIGPAPEVPEGYWLQMPQIPELGEDGKYHQVYNLIPLEV